MTGRTRSGPVAWGLLILVLANLIWAGSFSIAKVVMEEVSPWAMSFWRLLVPTLVFLPFIRRELQKTPLAAGDRLRLVIMGLVGCTAANALQFLGIQYSLASNIALIVSLEPLIIIGLAVMFLGEPLNGRKAVGFLLALVGGFLLSDFDWRRLDLLGGQYLLGNSLMAFSLICYALYTILGKDLMARYSATLVTAYPFVWGSLGMFPLLSIFDADAFSAWLTYRPASWAAVLYISVIGTLLGYWIWNWALGFIDAGVVSLTLYVQPLAGVLIARAWLGEELSGLIVLGGALILGAVVLCSGPFPRGSGPVSVNREPAPTDG